MKNPYVPLELPFEDGLVNPLTFLNELVEANVVLAQYQVMLKHTKIQDDLILNRLFSLQEAIYSSKIEGIKVSVDEVFEIDAQSKEHTHSTQQVINYLVALSKKEKLLSKELFTYLHAELFQNQSVSDYRKSQNYIGSGDAIHAATFVPPEPKLVDTYMSNLLDYINSDKEDVNHLVKVAIIHAQFETIHPFIDGNGRIGRMLIPLFLYNKGVIAAQNFFISEVLHKYRHRYYGYLNDVRSKQDWNQWICFFLKVVIEQAKKNMKMVEELDFLYERDISYVSRFVTNDNVQKIVDIMFMYPVFTVKLMVELSGISRSTCRRYLDILEQEDLIFSNERRYRKTYYYYNLLDRLR
ncbi:Fic family protein [Bacillus sp. S0628]|uniref:Fic family protein n=1 Tax=Bacillus sp. S0628 TaxID=2957802 RepID=UPI00209CB518|nr:Fic family protein [Bacillus sp. S0628]MCP1322071.1 Fic family protein [Bacillus sp. S0628]